MVSPDRPIIGGVPTDPVVVDATDVALMYERSEQQSWDIAEDFPCLAPPFPAMFIEAQFPWQDHHEYVCDPEKVSSLGLTGEYRVGGMFLENPATTERGVILEAHAFVGSDGQGRLAGKKPFQYIGSASFRLAADGAAVSGEKLEVIAGSFLTAAIKAGRIQREDAASNVLSTLHPLLLAISFMHCKNIVLRPVDPYEGHPKALRKHGPKPLVRYHTLNIEPMRTVLQREGAAESSGLKKALHICRGHFRHYVDKGLFGREELKGLFWTPQHARGSASAGVVEKDYRVKTPS